MPLSQSTQKVFKRGRNDLCHREIIRGKETVCWQLDLLGNLFRPGRLVRSVRDGAERQVIQDRDTGRSKGFGFVEMDTEAEAQAAIQGLNDQEYEGRRLTVNEAKPREPRSGGGGYGGGVRRRPLRRRWRGGRRWRRWRIWRRRWPPVLMDRPGGLHLAITYSEEPFPRGSSAISSWFRSNTRAAPGGAFPFRSFLAILRSCRKTNEHQALPHTYYGLSAEALSHLRQACLLARRHSSSMCHQTE